MPDSGNKHDDFFPECLKLTFFMHLFLKTNNQFYYECCYLY